MYLKNTGIINNLQLHLILSAEGLQLYLEICDIDFY